MSIRRHKKEPSGYSGVVKYNDQNEKFTKKAQQQFALAEEKSVNFDIELLQSEEQREKNEEK